MGKMDGLFKEYFGRNQSRWVPYSVWLERNKPFFKTKDEARFDAYEKRCKEFYNTYHRRFVQDNDFKRLKSIVIILFCNIKKGNNLEWLLPKFITVS